MSDLQSELKNALKANFTQNTVLFESYSKGMIQKL
jgi:hypothetical protein